MNSFDLLSNLDGSKFLYSAEGNGSCFWLVNTDVSQGRNPLEKVANVIVPCSACLRWFERWALG